MKISVWICVLMLAGSSALARGVETGALEEAKRIGEAHERAFFLFSTTVGQYIVRHDGMGEVSINARRRVFTLKLGKGRLEQVYFSEYQGDVVLVYKVSSGMGYVLRMNQRTRKTRWLTTIEESKVGPCAIEANEVRCGPADDVTKIDLNTGAQREPLTN